MPHKVLLLMLFIILNCEGKMSKTEAPQKDEYREKRERMVEQQIIARGVGNDLVIHAMRTVPRHLFVPHAYQPQAYEDYPLPIGHSQTISQPYIVAFMTEVLHLDGTERVLEIGTGSGYQAAVLSLCADSVYTIEIVEPLCDRASDLLAAMNYANCFVRCGNGYEGWPEHAPFDAIIVTAAPTEVPETLVEQLAPGGRMVIPVGKHMQHLKLITKDATGLVAEEKLMSVRFVPMTGDK